MPKKKGKRVPPAAERQGMTRKEFLLWLKKDPEKQKKKKKKPAPFPYWLFFAPPELYPDPILRPDDGWPADKIRRAAEPPSPWLGTPSLNEHLAHPNTEPLRGA